MIHWTDVRKAAVLVSIEAGELSEIAARNTYDISVEELAEWRRRYAAGGIAALRVKNTKKHRGAAP